MVSSSRAGLNNTMTEDADDILRRADWLNSRGLQALFSAIERDGDEARVVGGAIRNTLLGHSIPDVDIATTATPQDVAARASSSGLKSIATGIDHGTITVVSHGFAYEVTTLREDVETFGRQAKVIFGKDWVKDAERRDFTMNALYADRNGQLHDPLGGLQDCLDRRVRFIGDPDTRLREDYLRILRFFRIYAAYGQGEMDADGLGACLRQRDGLRQLSAERIGHEMRRLMQAPLAATALRMMNDCGLWEIATGGIARVEDYAALRDLDPLVSETRDPELGLTVLAGFVREDIERIADRLRLSNAERKRMQIAWSAIKFLRQLDELPEAEAMLYEFGRQGAIDGHLACWATLSAQDHNERVEENESYLDQLRSQSVPVFPLKGADLIAAGHKPGPGLGAKLRQLEKTWCETGYKLENEALIAGLADIS
ncbi:MAG: CCA tRNA nucleotidyltransferase [Roseibium sp.]